MHQVALGARPRYENIEMVHPLALPSGLQPVSPVGIGRAVAAHVDGRRGPLHDIEMRGIARGIGNALDGGRDGADDRDALVGKARHRAPAVPAGIVIVPQARSEEPNTELHSISSISYAAFGVKKKKGDSNQLYDTRRKK